MSAVLRLSLTWFTATPLTRRIAVVGILLMLVGIVGYAFIPGYFILNQGRGIAWYEALILGLPWYGLILLVVSTGFMPAMVERMITGRAVWVLPFGRARLLTSAVVPALVLSLLTAATATMVFITAPFDLSGSEQFRTFYRTLLMAFVDFGLIYMAIWLVGKTSGVWRLAGMLGIVVSITIPLRYTGGRTPFTFLEGIGLASWLVFAILLLVGGRTRHSLQDLRASVKALGTKVLPSFRYSGGHEVDLLLGTTRPWIVALGQALPIAVMVAFVAYEPIWIVFLVTFSAIAGAITSQAATLSRRLWLRYGWTRDEIYRRVHRTYWRYNAFSLGVLLVIYAVLASYAGYFDTRAVVLSFALIVVGGIACTYLGLMITRGLGWLESAAGILTMTALVLAAISIARSRFTVAAELEILIAALAITFAVISKRRWTTLDWMQCRADPTARAAA